MIRFGKQKPAFWQERFLALLPLIESYVVWAFRSLRPEERREGGSNALPVPSRHMRA